MQHLQPLKLSSAEALAQADLNCDFSFVLLQSVRMQNMKIIDTKGQKCPGPIIETKKALRESMMGETFKVITDNKTSFANISRFLGDNKIKYSVSEERGIWTFLITNETGQAVTNAAGTSYEVNAPKKSQAGFAVAISSELMGKGDDDLGRQLMKSFLIALSCLDEIPEVVAFYNSGVKLALKDSDTIEPIQDLERKGTEIILCSTCVDHFKISDKIGAGRIGDMYIIAQKLSSAGNVLRP